MNNNATEKIINIVRDFLIEYKISSTTILVGLSGGCDSVVLLDVLSKLKTEFDLEIIVAHLNHNWRGEESLRDEKFCAKLADKMGLEFVCEKLGDNIKKTEEMAREARYNFFEKTAQNFSANYVFLAHNKNDNAETVLYRIIKGTALCGLSAISQVREIFYRPLLNVLREEIEQYAEKNKLKFVFDSSNSNEKYARNYIRNTVLPLFLKINPNVIFALDNLSKISKNQLEILNSAISDAKKAVFEEKKIKLEEFYKLSKPMQLEIVNDFLKGELKNRDTKGIERYLEFLLKADRKNISINSSKFLKISDGFAYIFENEKQEKNMAEVIVNGYGVFNFGGKIIEISQCSGEIDLKEQTDEKYFYCDLSNLTLRTRREGDLFCPFGHTKPIKLKEYLIKKKIPQSKRDNLVLLACEREVFCILGVEISAKCMVQNFDKYYKISIK